MGRPHGFILEAIAEKAELEERRAPFVDSVEQRCAGLVASLGAVHSDVAVNLVQASCGMAVPNFSWNA